MKINLTKQCMTILTASTLIAGTNYIKPKVIELKAPLRGIEVSDKIDINWDNYGKDYDYVVINVGNGLNLNDKFEENYDIAHKKGIPVGVFIDNTLAKKEHTDENDIVLQAERRYSAIKINQLMSKKINYPVYLKLDYGDRPIEDALPKKYANALLDRFEMIMTYNDFVPGIYSNEHNINYLRENVDDFDVRFASLLDKEKEEKLPLLAEDFRKYTTLPYKKVDLMPTSISLIPKKKEEKKELNNYVYSNVNYYSKKSILPLSIIGLTELMVLSKLFYNKYQNKKNNVKSFIVKL